MGSFSMKTAVVRGITTQALESEDLGLRAHQWHLLAKTA